MSAKKPKVVCHFLPGEVATTLLVLRGTGGGENSLIPLGWGLASGAGSSPGAKTERLAEILRKAGAEVELRWRDAGLT